MFIGKYNKSVIVTFIGVFAAMTGMFSILAFDEPRLTMAIICLIIAGICDMFDGKVARMCENRTDEDAEYGIQLDSLTDMISFIAFPIVTLYGMSKYFNVGLNPIITVIAVSLFTIGGITRLAFFNLAAASADGPVKYYTGMPVTTTSMIFPLLYLLRYVLSPSLFVGVYLAFFSLIAFLFVVNVKLPKPKKIWWYTTCSICAVVMTAILLYLRFIK